MTDKVKGPPATTWQERAIAEANELGKKTDKLRTLLIRGGTGDAQTDELLRQQYGLMTRYYDVLMARLRLAGAVSVETPPLVRDEAAPVTAAQLEAARGTPAAVEVTVSAPAGKRGMVELRREEGGTRWTVTEGQSQTWSLAPGESVHVGQQSTVEKVFDPS